jgi:RimJ/RimL family protein N-acetyltransferase
MNSLFSAGYEKLYLWVLEDNHPARRFYEKNGFDFNGDTLEYVIEGKPLNEVRYVFKKGEQR